MAIAPGKHLGPYKILSELGAGGMGEVYRAKDTRLDRTVAIKVLPSHLADKPQLRERFEREARAIASLNHPHICTLHDIGQQDKIHYLVMEYLEGESMAQRLAKGPLPLDQVLRYAIEIADALDKAHRQGVTHRDLKPANIMVTKAGTKLLDFGLAKLKQEAAPDNVPFSELPTAKDSLTAEGTILGTLQYMAPEQVEGKVEEIDARTDIFAFGAVIYEMATGKRAFEGKSSASVMAKILEIDPPPMSSLQPMTPPALDRVVKRCLAKDRDERWQTAYDLWQELKWVVEAGAQAGKEVAVAPRRKIRERLAWAVAAVAILLALALAVPYFGRSPTPTETMRFSLSLPRGPTPRIPLSVSPDGRSLAFVGTDSSGKILLQVRHLGSLTTQPLAGAEGSAAHFWSPDSRFLGFFADGKLKKVNVSSGEVQTVADAPSGRGGAWNRDGMIIFAPDIYSGLVSVSASGGVVSPVTTLDSSRQETSHRFPQFLPDGRHFLYLTLNEQRENRGIYVGSLDSKETNRLLSTRWKAAYAPPGYLLFLRQETLMAQPFDAVAPGIDRRTLSRR